MKKIIFIPLILAIVFSFYPRPSLASQDESVDKIFSETDLTIPEKQALEKFYQFGKGAKAGYVTATHKMCASNEEPLSAAEKKAKQKFEDPFNNTDINKKSISRTYNIPDSDYAKESRPTRHRFYISGGYNRNYMNYKEITKRTNTILDEDHGYLNGFYAAAGYKDNHYIEWLFGKPFIEAYFQNYDALITYGSDAVSFGDEIAKVRRFGAKLGLYREFSEKGDVFGYLDIGKRVWDRGQDRIIQGITDYSETYWWTYFGFGLGFNYELFPRFSAGIEAEVMYAPKRFAKMHSNLFEGGTFDLGMVLGADFKLPFKYYLLKNLSIDLTPYFTYWEISESNAVSITGTEYYEPYSRTYIKGVLAGLTLRF